MVDAGYLKHKTRVCWGFSRMFGLFMSPSPGGPWGQGILQQRPPVLSCPEATLARTGMSGPERDSAPPPAYLGMELFCSKCCLAHALLSSPCRSHLTHRGRV